MSPLNLIATALQFSFPQFSLLRPCSRLHPRGYRFLNPYPCGNAHFSLVKVINLPALLAALASNVDLYLASDGGAIPLKDSFGAILATSDTILVECGDRAFGQDPRSFRSEAYGMLAVTRLLFHLRAFHQLNMSRMTLALVCNSLSLLDRLSASRKLTWIVP
jgi:hypothetical protein